VSDTTGLSSRTMYVSVPPCFFNKVLA
jgi:hypothetical protein